MKKLVSAEDVGGRVERTWAHYDDAGKKAFTVETIQDVEPVFKAVKRNTELSGKGDFRFRASIPATVIEETAKIKAQLWGVKKIDAFREIMQGRTDRAKSVWNDLLYGRDYRKLQAGQ